MSISGGTITKSGIVFDTIDGNGISNGQTPSIHNFILLESGEFLLFENSGKIKTEG